MNLFVYGLTAGYSGTMSLDTFLAASYQYHLDNLQESQDDIGSDLDEDIVSDGQEPVTRHHTPHKKPGGPAPRKHAQAESLGSDVKGKNDANGPAMFTRSKLQGKKDTMFESLA